MRHPARVLVALLLAAPLVPAASAQDPAVFYEDNCSSCHSIGEGVLGGPDLKGVTTRRDREWLIQFLLNPEAFAGDPVVRKMIEEADGTEMAATEGLTRQMAEALLALIEQRSGGAQTLRPERPITVADVEFGRALFTGRATLSGSASPCIACHAAGDVRASTAGRLGADLTAVHGRLGGRRGVNAWLGSPPTPMMRALHRRAPLTADEIHALAAFLELPRDPASPGAAAVPAFVLAGTAAGLLFVGLAGVVWQRRFRSVRRPLVSRGRHSALGAR